MAFSPLSFLLNFIGSSFCGQIRYYDWLTDNNYHAKGKGCGYYSASYGHFA